MCWPRAQARRPTKKAASTAPTAIMSSRKKMEPRGLRKVLPRSLIQLAAGLKAHG